MTEKRTTVKRDRHQEHHAWKMKLMMAALNNWITGERKGTKQKKARWGRSGARRRSRRRATDRARVKKKMTQKMMRNRRRKGQNARSGR